MKLEVGVDKIQYPARDVEKGTKPAYRSGLPLL